MKATFLFFSFIWFLTYSDFGSALNNWCHKRDSDSINGDILKSIYPSDLKEKYILWSSQKLTFKECVSKCCDESKCNVAFMFSKMCFLFSCQQLADSSCEPLVKEEDEEEDEETFWFTVREVEEQRSIKPTYSTSPINNGGADITDAWKDHMDSLFTSKLNQADDNDIIKDNNNINKNVTNHLSDIIKSDINKHNNNNTINDKNNSNTTNNKKGHNDNNQHNSTNNVGRHNVVKNTSITNSMNCSLPCSNHGLCHFSDEGGDVVMLCRCEVPYTHNPLMLQSNCDWNLVNVCFLIIITTITLVIIFTFLVCKLCKRKKKPNEYEALKRYRRKDKNSFYADKYFDSSSDNVVTDEEDEDEYLVMSHLREMENSKRVLLGGKDNLKSKNISNVVFADQHKSVDKNNNNLHDMSDDEFDIMISDHSRRKKTVDKDNKYGTKVAFDKKHQFSLVGAGVRNSYDSKVFS